MQRQAPPPNTSLPRAKRSVASWAVPLVGLTVVYITLVATVRNQYYQLMLTLVPVWATLGISWNILSGYSGLVSFGHAAFFGLGAYTLTILFVFFGVTPWIGLPRAGLAGALAGLIIGYPTFRLRGHYFALSMLAYPLAMLYVFEWLGLQEVSLPMRRDAPAAFMQFSDSRIYSLMALALMIAALLVSLKVERSRFGMSLLAIKQNEIAAEASGIDAFNWKLKAIVVSGAIAGTIGGFYVMVLLVVTPQTVFGMLTSAQALIMALFGGVGSAWGPVIGAAILIPLAEILQAELGDKLAGIQGVVLGAAIILIILTAPEGIYWKVRDTLQRRAPADGQVTRVVMAADLVVPAPTVAAGPARTAPSASAPVLLDVRGLWEEARRAESGAGRQLLGARGRDPRHHRTERGREDDTLQCAQWDPRGRQRQCHLCGQAGAGSTRQPGLPPRHRPHVPGRTPLSAPVGARQRRCGRLCGRAVRRRGICARPGRSGTSRHGARCASAGGWVDDQGPAFAGTGARP